MLTWIMDYGKKKIHASMIDTQYVLEIGANNVNGSLKEHIMMMQPGGYIGVDIQRSKDTNLQIDAADLHLVFQPNTFGFVLSTETLEHCEDWKQVVCNIINLLKPGGWCFISTCTRNFAIHGYPQDYWRFERSDFEEIFRGMEHLEVETQQSENSIVAMFKMSNSSKEQHIEHIVKQKVWNVNSNKVE